MTSDPFVTRRFFSRQPSPGEVLNLNLSLGGDQFSYAIFEGAYHNLVELCEVQITSISKSSYAMSDLAERLIQDHLLQQKKFEKVNVMVLSQEFTIAPQVFAEKEQARELLHFSGTPVMARTLQQQVNGVVFTSGIAPELLNLIEKAFPQASIRHSSFVCSCLLLQHAKLAETQLFLHAGESFIELAAKKSGGLLFYNNYQVSSSEDALYYILFAMEQFGFDPLSVKISITGQKPGNDDLIKSIRKYIKQVDFVSPDPSVQLPAELSGLPGHFYFLLLNLQQCAS